MSNSITVDELFLYTNKIYPLHNFSKIRKLEQYSLLYLILYKIHLSPAEVITKTIALRDMILKGLVQLYFNSREGYDPSRMNDYSDSAVSMNIHHTYSYHY